MLGAGLEACQVKGALADRPVQAAGHACPLRLRMPGGRLSARVQTGQRPGQQQRGGGTQDPSQLAGLRLTVQHLPAGKQVVVQQEATCISRQCAETVAERATI